MRKERIGKIGYRICAVLAAAVSLWCMGDNLWPVVKENGAAWALRAAGLQAAAQLRQHGVRAPLAFFAHTPAYAYEAFRVDAMQYLHIPFRPEQLTALLDRATEPEYGPVIPVTTAMGLRALPFADIEYLECTHHVVHYHLASGEDVASLSLRVPFAEVAKPLLADARFLQPHRSYVVNLAAAAQLSSGELWMRSGARVPIPRGREPAVRAAFRAFLEG